MAEKRRGLGRGISALIPQGGSGVPASDDRPVDVFFPDNGNGRTSNGADVESAPSRTGRATRPRDETKTPAGASSGRSASKRTKVPALDLTPPANPAESSATDVATNDGLVPVPGATYAEIPVGQITPNARQPRQVFDEEELEELASSIAEVGLLQPVVVRPRATQDVDAGEAPFELVMGERRWRATQSAGLDTIPAIVRTTTDDDLLRDALLENLHRVQLNPLEEANAYQQLLDDFACTHEELARRIARSRPQISNTIRLLKLPPLVQRRVASGVLSAGHARALLGLADAAAMERLAQRIVAEGLSVRSTEEIVAMGDEPEAPEMRRRRRESPHAEGLDRLANRLADRFDTRVKVSMGQRKGRITIEFAGAEDLERILDTLAPGEAVRETPAPSA